MNRRNNRQVIINALALFFGQTLTRFSGLIFVPIIAHKLGGEQLGAYQLSMVLMNYAYVIVLLGLSQFAVREIIQKPESEVEIFAQVLAIRIPLSVVAS